MTGIFISILYKTDIKMNLKLFFFFIKITLRKHGHATYSDFHACKNENFQLKFFD